MTKLTHGLAALLAAAWLTLSPPALAQDAPDAKSVELSTQLFELAGAKTLMVQLLDRISPSLTQLVQQANPGKAAEVAEVMNNFIMPKMKQRLPEMIHEGAVVYAKHFSADELGQLVQFYQSPLGEKLVHEQALMSEELGRIGSAWAQAVATQAIREYADEFRKRGLQTPI
jgi:hypothetical protein